MRTADEGRKRQRSLLCGHHHAGFRRRRATLWAINPPIGELFRDPKDHCLGSRSPHGGFPPPPEPPSMEGRTMIRMRHPPLQWRAGGVGGGAHNVAGPSMEGRTIVRPDHQIRTFRTHILLPASMEGRTIVRPDPETPVLTRLHGPGFNGGPDNCPARHQHAPDQGWFTVRLQWRAGQLSGQTYLDGVSPMPRLRASMEGRTIVRPDRNSPPEVHREPTSFNGGPDNCPARRKLDSGLSWCS